MTHTENLPLYLRQHGQFCLWKYEENPDKPEKPRKMPYNPHYSWERAATDRPDTFSDMQTAEAAQAGFSGLGIRIHGGMSGIDIDDCVTNGELSPMAQDIIQQMDTYTEYSPSGKGIRILFLAPGFSYDTEKYYVKNSTIGLEVYIAGMTNRYLTVTGNVIHAKDMESRADRLQYILDKYMLRPQDKTAPAATHTVEIDMTDAELLEKAREAKNGPQFSALWAGDFAGYPSQSEADQALCNLLAFWTGRDAARIDSLFRQSGLYRKKWDRRDYREGTIKRAINTCQEVYTPKKPTEAPQKPQKAAEPTETQTQGQKPAEATPQADFDTFFATIQTEKYKPVRTGITEFDELLGGGILRQSLVMLTAAPGTGKTSITQQIFETMAAQGTDVIFLNLEMSKEQLLARSMSRIIHRQGHNMTAAEVLKGYAWTEYQRGYVTKAAQTYKAEIAQHMIYNPAGCTTDIESIRNTLTTAGLKARAAGQPGPVCVLDYLHLITTSNREEQAELIKKSVAMLKQYAIEFDTFVLAIGANNRDTNRSGIVGLESGRDTSAIEYSADYQIGLNYRALAEKLQKPNGETYKASNPDDMEALQNENPRKMIVQCLKNRMNAAGGKIYLNFDAANSTFVFAGKPKKKAIITQIPTGFTRADDDPDNPYI